MISRVNSLFRRMNPPSENALNPASSHARSAGIYTGSCEPLFSLQACSESADAAWAIMIHIIVGMRHLFTNADLPSDVDRRARGSLYRVGRVSKGQR